MLGSFWIGTSKGTVLIWVKKSVSLTQRSNVVYIVIGLHVISDPMPSKRRRHWAAINETLQADTCGDTWHHIPQEAKINETLQADTCVTRGTIRHIDAAFAEGHQ